MSLGNSSSTAVPVVGLGFPFWVGTTAPANPSEGNGWYNPTTKIISVYESGAWNAATSGGGGGGGGTGISVTGASTLAANQRDLELHMSDGSVVTVNLDTLQTAQSKANATQVATNTAALATATAGIAGKADSSVQIISSDAQLVVTNPDLTNDVTLDLQIGGNNGLVTFDATGSLPASALPAGTAMVNNINFDASGALPVGARVGDMIRVGTAGTQVVVPLTGGAPTATALKQGELLQLQADGNWHMLSAAPTTDLNADHVHINPTIAGLGANAQTALNTLETGKVPTTRTLTSSDIQKLSIDALVSGDLTADRTLTVHVNSPNGLAGLTAGGVLPASIMPSPTTSYVGTLDASSGTLPADRTAVGGVGAWVAGDTLQILAPGTLTVKSAASPSVAAPAAVQVNDLLTFDSTGAWVLSNSGAATNVPASAVATAAATAGTNLNGATLVDVFARLNSDVVWLTGVQHVTGDKEFDTATVHTLTIGATATQSVLPTTQGTNGQTLITNGTGTVTWGDIAANRVSFTPAGNIAATTVQTALAEVDSEKAALAPTSTQVIRGSGSAAHTGLEGGNAGVIRGDGSTANQIGMIVLDEGVEGSHATDDAKLLFGRSNTTGTVPTTLNYGQIFLNIADNAIYIGNAANRPQLYGISPHYRGTIAAGVLTKISGTVGVSRVSAGVFDIVSDYGQGLVINVDDGFVWGEIFTGVPAGSRRITVRDNTVLGQPPKDPDNFFVKVVA